MSKRILAVCGLVLSMAAAAYAADDYTVYQFGSQALGGDCCGPYSNVTPSGMRFGDIPQVGGAVEVASGNCQNCWGVQAPCGDPCWRGPCMDWKLIGWYSHWSDGHHGCRKKCCAQTCDSGCMCD